MRAALACLVALAACYAPKPHAGAPCGANGECPAPLACSPTGFCDVAGAGDGGPLPDDGPIQQPDSSIDARLIDGCSPAPEICGDGIDQDCDGSDATCPANDRPDGAIDVTAGGTFTADVRAAHDDAAPGACGSAGGRDVFYSVTLASPEVYYFDTLGANFDSVIRVTPGTACGGVSAGMPACADDACGGKQSQLAVALPVGTSCIVVDQASAAETAGNVVLVVQRERRTGTALASGMHSVMGDTCGSTNIDDPVDVNCDSPGSAGKDVAFFFTACPMQTWKLDASTCTGTNYDSVLYVRGKMDAQLACNDDSCNSSQAAFQNATLTGSLFYWLIVDGFDATECGAFTLTTNLR